MSPDLEGASCSEEAARLLPWYVNGTLSAPDAARVADHLVHCAICRQDIAHETSVRALLRTEANLDYAPQAGLTRTLSRIDELAREPPAAASAATGLKARAPRRIGALQWLTGAVLAQAVALGWLGISLHRQARPVLAAAPYQTLAADPATLSPLHIRLVPAASMTLADFTVLLTGNHLTVVHGPSEAGVYTVAPTDSRVSAAAVGAVVAALRTRADVLLAEPAVNDAPANP